MRHSFVSAGLLACLAGFITAPQASAKKILIYGPSNGRESMLATAAGHTVTVDDAATWAARTQASFASFDAIVFGDPYCVTGTSTVATADANKTVWSAAVTGNKIVIGTDPSLHAFRGIGAADVLATNAINFAANGLGTGIYASLSCYYALVSSSTSVSFLSGIGNFTVSGQFVGGSTSDSVSIVNPSHPAMAGLTSTGPSSTSLSGWGESVHEWFNSFPGSFTVLATEISGTPASRPYIIASGGGVPFSSFNPSLVINSFNFDLYGTFIPGAGSQGINPITNPVTIAIGSFQVTIPAGSFQGFGGNYWFYGTVNGLSLNVTITAVGNTYYFKAIGYPINLTGSPKPVTVTFSIGPDFGTASANW